MKALVIGFKLWLILLLTALAMAIPTAILWVLKATFPVIGMILGVAVFILYLVVLGWLVFKFKKFIFGRM
jgi:hypothetical protein